MGGISVGPNRTWTNMFSGKKDISWLTERQYRDGSYCNKMLWYVLIWTCLSEKGVRTAIHGVSVFHSFSPHEHTHTHRGKISRRKRMGLSRNKKVHISHASSFVQCSLLALPAFHQPSCFFFVLLLIHWLSVFTYSKKALEGGTEKHLEPSQLHLFTFICFLPVDFKRPSSKPFSVFLRNCFREAGDKRERESDETLYVWFWRLAVFFPHCFFGT